MAELEVRPSGVALLEARQLHLVTAAVLRVSPEHRRAMDRVWDAAVQGEPDWPVHGSVVVCAGVEWESPESVVPCWTRV